MGFGRLIIGLYRRYALWKVKRLGLTIGKDCRFAKPPSWGSEPYLITIGDHVGFAGNVSFITHDGGTWVFRDQERYKKVIKYGRINIKDNCVIGERVIILLGVTIGPNSVVAAGSVVSRNIPPGVLASGNPARPVMTVEQYAEWSLAGTPDYDPEEYRRDKRACLTKVVRRGTAARPYHREGATRGEGA
jgi:acetyltransferase-like isoleucine patch superfamily enzyme